MLQANAATIEVSTDAKCERCWLLILGVGNPATLYCLLHLKMMSR
jgi:hypothetical protein